MSRSLARQRYNRRMLWLVSLYAVFLIGATYGFKHGMITGPVAYAAAILPALPIIGIFAAMGRYLVEQEDEYVRMLLVRQALWAGGFSLTLVTIWGFLEKFGLFEHFESWLIAPLFFIGMGVGAAVNKLTIGDSGGTC